MRLMSAIFALLLPAMAWADSVPVFKDYAAYSSFMDEQITTRDVAGFAGWSRRGRRIVR